MRCNVCGAQVDDGTKTCPYCGCAVEGDGKETTVYSASGEVNANESAAPVNGATSFDYSSVSREAGPAVGLKWAHFLGYFALWIGALANLANGIRLLTGSLYEEQGVTAEMVYAFWGNSLKYADKFYSVCLIITAVLAVCGAVAILKYKAIAGTLVSAVYAVNAISGIAYIAMTTHILGQSTLDYQTAVSIIVAIVFFCVNIVYFKKRKHIFVN
ncbi:MAG: zinc ribbon domain-containing protein [Lachnospiraceae bacterium]|nr:zinc ribbon domain-containing protein [Lachnospiraceae bacterium]